MDKIKPQKNNKFEEEKEKDTNQKFVESMMKRMNQKRYT